MPVRQDICGLLASRICHDLINPVGAISNGIELLGLEAQLGRSAELALVRESVESAAARIRFIRVAFGLAGEGQYLARSEIQGLLSDWLAHGRLSIDWQVVGDHPRREVRRVILALMCLETALPMGGILKVTRSPDAWLIYARGTRARIDMGLWRILIDDDVADKAELTPARVQFLLLRADLEPEEGDIGFTEHADGIDLVVPARRG